MDIEKLKSKGYDGLYCVAGDPCGCEFKDIAPCGDGPTDQCKPGYKLFHPTEKGIWAIWASKDEKEISDWEFIGLDY